MSASSSRVVSPWAARSSGRRSWTISAATAWSPVSGSTAGFGLRNKPMSRPSGNPTTMTQVDVLPGRGTLVPIEVFRRIGTFNRRRFLITAPITSSVSGRDAPASDSPSHIAQRSTPNSGSPASLHPTDRGSLMAECIRLLCSRKSTANFRYYLSYVWLCSEPGHKWRNTLSHGVGLLLGTVGKTVVGFPLQICSRIWLKGNRTVKVS